MGRMLVDEEYTILYTTDAAGSRTSIRMGMEKSVHEKSESESCIITNEYIVSVYSCLVSFVALVPSFSFREMT